MTPIRDHEQVTRQYPLVRVRRQGGRTVGPLVTPGAGRGLIRAPQPVPLCVPSTHAIQIAAVTT